MMLAFSVRAKRLNIAPKSTTWFTRLRSQAETAVRSDT